MTSNHSTLAPSPASTPTLSARDLAFLFLGHLDSRWLTKAETRRIRAAMRAEGCGFVDGRAQLGGGVTLIKRPYQSRLEVVRLVAPRPTYTPIPATCKHSDRPAWPPSETQLCHECEDRKFRAAMFAIGAKAAGFNVAPGAAELAGAL